MSTVLFHRTSIAEARSIVQHGFEDVDWDFGLKDARTGEDTVVTGVWLTDRPIGRDEGIDGDALLEVTVDLTEEELKPFELEGMLWDTQLWIASAELINAHGKARILEVDPRTSWWHEALDTEE
ncbi:MAG: hypothetical protein GTN62_02030 [Gemmatimonadales bacterium]|nr:hypothetical protein [Gemmatimonadales bacterium]NIN12343.1 hypothetical protein [Gemmatimonadales bacterium]NIN48881.1 hypothetical protein [Gemmatimonadales bacterium]NIP06345.1 hypothetical protein [Gemmatimonadales bacterium]NIR00718.1 hypothetical protein [Gemmatimonadales bacterium]